MCGSLKRSSPRALTALSAAAALSGVALAVGCAHPWQHAVDAAAKTPSVDAMPFGEFVAGERSGGASINLTIANDGRFTYAEDGPMPLRCTGQWSINEGLIELTPARASDDDPYPKMPLTWRPVHWGSRLYLVPDGKIIRFCNAINLGDEPRSTAEGVNPLRRGDWSRPVSGRPELPREWLDLLLRYPLAGRVVDVEPDGFVRLSIGGNDGLRPGMALAVCAAGEARCCELKIVCPCENRARAEVIGREACALAEAPWGDVQIGDEAATSRTALSWRARTRSGVDLIFTPEMMALPVNMRALQSGEPLADAAPRFASAWGAVRAEVAAAISSADIRRLALRMPELMEGAAVDRKWLDALVLSAASATEPSGRFLFTHPVESGQPLPAARAVRRRLCLSVEYDPARGSVTAVYITIRGWVEE